MAVIMAVAWAVITVAVGLPHAHGAGFNGMLIKASDFNDREELGSLCHPFHFKELGNEWAEADQLQRDLGWTSVKEVGKFYDYKGSNDWYFYVYGTSAPGDGHTLPVNVAATKACGDKIRGDVVLVKSGPMDSDFDPNMTVEEVVESIMHYMGSNDPESVYQTREKARASKKYGVDLTNQTGVFSIRL